jgi:hypothetical protein
MRSALAPLVVIAALALVGCQDPYARDHTESPRAPAQPTTAAPTATERPGRSTTLSPAPDAPAPSSRSARATARAFGSRWVNWDWRTATGQQGALAGLAAADLASQLRANARSARIDATLARDRPGSRGRVLAVQVSTSGGRAAGIVVTREQTLTDGRADLGGARYRVYTIRLVEIRRYWEVSAWTPQP